MKNHISLREWVRAPLPYAGESVQLVTLPGSALGPWAELQHSEPEVPLHLGTAPLYLQQFLIRGPGAAVPSAGNRPPHAVSTMQVLLADA